MFIFKKKYIVIIVGLKDLAKSSLFHIKPKAHAKKEETSKDE